MRHYLKIFLCLSILLASTTHCQTNEKTPSAAVQKRKETEVASNGETIVTANSTKCKIKVIIKTHEIKKEINEAWNKKLSPVPATCKEASWCSLVDKMDIIVNGKQIRIPQSLVARLAVLTTAEVRTDGRSMILLLAEGDGSEADFVKIEFDYDRVTKMSAFADDSMDKSLLIHEEIFH